MGDLLNQIGNNWSIIVAVLGAMFAYEKRIKTLEVKMDHIQDTLTRILSRLNHA